MSDKAQLCPHCGKPNTLLSNNASRSSSSTLVWGLIGYIVFSLAFIPFRIMLYDSSYGSTYMVMEIDYSVRCWFMFIAIIASIFVAKSNKNKLLFSLWAIVIVCILQSLFYYWGMMMEDYVNNTLFITRWVVTFLAEMGVISLAAIKREASECNAVSSANVSGSSVAMPLLLGVVVYIVLSVPLNVLFLNEVRGMGKWWLPEFLYIAVMLVPIFICVFISKSRYDRLLCSLLVIAVTFLISNLTFYLFFFIWKIMGADMNFMGDLYLYTLWILRFLVNLCIVVIAAMRRKKYFAKMGNV